MANLSSTSQIEAPLAPTAPDASTSAPDAGGSSPGVLLVDDRLDNLIALEAILEPLRLRLVRALSADDALRHVLQEQFAVILLDVQMPGTGGLETARLIKQRAKSEHVPIIFLTALDRDRRHATLGYESGAVDYLFKPLDPDVLRAKVSAFVELDRLRDALAKQQGRRFADQAVRESEERYRLVQKATNDVIWDWDLVSGSVRWNELASTAFRLGDGEPSNDVEWWTSHIHPDDRARVMDGIHAVIESRTESPWSAEYRFRLGDGTYRTFLDRGYVARDATGRPIRMIGAMQDVTERVVARAAAEAAQAAAEQARAAAEEASRLKSEFLTTMSHEFRTPLNAVLGYAQLLDMGVLGPATAAQHAHLERLQASARHLMRLVDDVLDIARIDADRLEVRRESLLTGAAIAGALAVVQPLATAKGVRLIDRGAGAPGVPYVGDDHRVRQVLLNLLANAIKFTPPGGEVAIECGAAEEAEPGVWRPDAERDVEVVRDAWAFIRIHDTGPGIPTQILERLFEPFVQGDGALTREQGGAGLGLAISRRLARLMGGDLVARSPRGAGATFTLWLPAARSAAQAPLEPPGERRANRRATGHGGISTDDDPKAPLDNNAYAVLDALGMRLSADAETIVARYETAIRSDERFPGIRTLPSIQLRDHAVAMVALLASQLMVVGQTRGEAPELLGDGAQLQRVMSELHGAQRYRIGWSDADIERGGALLFAEMEHAIRSALDTLLTEGVPGSDGVDRLAIPGSAVEAAARHAADMTRHTLEQAARTAIRAYRFAKAAATT